MNKIIKISLNNDFEIIKKDNKVFLNICLSKDIYEGKGIKVSFEEDIDMQLAVFRIKQELYCLSNICPHRHAEEIYNGIIQNMELTCPMHGWTYHLDTGQNINPLQGLKSLKKFEIFEQDGKVFIEKPELEVPKWRKS